MIDSPLKSIQIFSGSSDSAKVIRRYETEDEAFYSDREYKQGTSATNLYRLKLEWLTRLKQTGERSKESIDDLKDDNFMFYLKENAM